jgi:hypothetical protein
MAAVAFMDDSSMPVGSLAIVGLVVNRRIASHLRWGSEHSSIRSDGDICRNSTKSGFACDELLVAHRGQRIKNLPR